MPNTATPITLSQDFPLSSGIFTNAKITLSASTDADATAAILSPTTAFPDRDIDVGHISFTADTGQVTVQPSTIGGASLSFDISASAQSGMGVYTKSADALSALNLPDKPNLQIPDADGQRFLLMDFGYSGSFSGSVSHPIGVLGSVSFGVDAKGNSVYAVLHRFDKAQPAHDAVADTIASWLLPRHVAMSNGNLNLKPATWVLAEADGSLALKLAASLGWNMSFARDLQLLGVTHNLSAKIDASLTATLGFNVAGKYVVVVGREDQGAAVHLQLFKQSSKGLDFGFNLNVGLQGSDPQLPTNFDDFIKSVFGLHGLQVLNDLHEWTDPNSDLGQKLAGLIDDTALKLVNRVTGVNAATVIDAQFAQGKKIIGDALDTWTNLPDKVSSMLWTFLGQNLGDNVVNDFKTFLADLSNPSQGADALAEALQNATFGDNPEGQFLESVADQGLLALANQLGPLSTVAGQVLNVLNGGLIAKLQDFINQALDLDQIRNAVSDADFNHINQWLQDRLGTYLDKVLQLADLKDVQTAIKALDDKVEGYYVKGVEALTKRYSAEFAAAYQQNTSDTALLDVTFDLSKDAASNLFSDVVKQSNLDELLTTAPDGVSLKLATLSHEITRTDAVELHMPFFDFTQIHINDTMVNLTAEDQGGRLLMYDISSNDSVTVANRMASQLSLLASLKIQPGQPPQFDGSAGTIGYELRQVKSSMRPDDLTDRTQGFINLYLSGLFGAGDSSLQTFYIDLDHAITAAVGNQSNQLGDIALSMQLSLPIDVLAGWFQSRSGSQLKADQVAVSQALQVAWRTVLPALYFQNLDNFQPEPNAAALLVWSSLPLSTDLDPSAQTAVYWDFLQLTLRRAVAQSNITVGNLVARLAGIHDVLVQDGNNNAGSFTTNSANNLISSALSPVGDSFFQALLITERNLVEGAADALKNITDALNTAASAPTTAIRKLADFASAITDTFHNQLGNTYDDGTGTTSRILGPMLLVEASRALGFVRANPTAMFNLYALKPGHTFQLSTFVDGTMPPEKEVALPQTLVNL